MFQMAYGVSLRFPAKCSFCFPLGFFCLLLFIAVFGISSEAFSLLLIENTVNCEIDKSALRPHVFVCNLPL